MKINLFFLLILLLLSCDKDKIATNDPNNNNSNNSNNNTGNGGTNTTNSNNTSNGDKEAKLIWITSLGGNGDEFMRFFTQTNDGKYLWGGYTDSDKSGNKELDIDQTYQDYRNYNCYMVRSDDNGKIVKQNNYPSGMIFSAANTIDNFYFSNFPTILYGKTSGNILSIGGEDWVHSPTLVINNKDLAFFYSYIRGINVQPSKDQKVLLLADYGPGLVIFKVDQKTDEIIWRTSLLIKNNISFSFKESGSSDIPKLLVNTSGDMFLVSTERNPTSTTTQFIKIIKIGKDGNIIWEKSYDNNLYESLRGAALTDNSDIIISKQNRTNKEGTVLRINSTQGDIIKEIKINGNLYGNDGHCLVQKNGDIIVFHGNTILGIYDGNLQSKGIVKLSNLDLSLNIQYIYQNKNNELVLAGSSNGTEKYPSFGKSDFRLAKISW